MKKKIIFLIVIIILIGLTIAFKIIREPADLPMAEKSDLIRVTYPRIGDTITSPLVIRGEARGNWFFEATFPVVLTNWDGLIIAQHYAEAKDEWMTTEYVPFEATLEFTSPYHAGDPDPAGERASYGASFMKRGFLILKKDNPSGLPEHDNALEIQIFFNSP